MECAGGAEFNENQVTGVFPPAPYYDYHSDNPDDKVAIVALPLDSEFSCLEWQRRFDDGEWVPLPDTSQTVYLPLTSAPGTYRYRVRNGGGAWTESADIIVAKVNILRVWSDQFPNEECNGMGQSFPPGVNPKEYMLIGSRSDDRIYVKAELEVIPDTQSVRDLLHIGYSDGTQPITPMSGGDEFD